MTRGRPPVKAVKEAIGMAKIRSGVWEVPENTGLPFDFVIFSGFCIWFIKVRRTRSNLSELWHILQLCNADIHDFRMMPESAVSVRELWVLAPHGTWQFFRILADGVTEIRSDGSTMPGTLASSQCQHPVLPAGSVISDLGIGGHPSVPVGVCHYLSSLQEKT
jgi:hypothetical protein